ncbi:MAG: hypothetical protein CL920_04535 [Deltaproteobacteria bacterium]|nr:hypothetical protein [Deltaproteobacteria bacterium]MBU47945.1 hypothetical protein [Deltaproteobacteria bacterium]
MKWLCSLFVLVSVGMSSYKASAKPTTRPALTKKVSSKKIAKRPLYERIKPPADTLHRAFYFLHQATGFFESWLMMQTLKKKLCLNALNVAKTHLGQANKLIRSSKHPLASLYTKLQGLLQRAEHAPFAEVELLRVDLSLLIEQHKLPHKRIWHKAFFACRKTKVPDNVR